MKRISLFLLFLCLHPIAMYAQTAEVGGAVQDPTGAVIQKASLEFRNQDTGVRRQTTTNSDGIYHIIGIDPGKYDATVQASGFKTLTRENIVFRVAEKSQIDFKLEIGQEAQTITVDGGGLQINTTDASVSTVIESDFVQNIPMNGRSFQDLISLTPGVITQSPQNQQGIGIANGGDFSVNGQRTESNYYTVDGVSANISSGSPTNVGTSAASGSIAATTALGTTQSLISVDALQEFRVQSSSYSAEFGRTPGGQFSLVTRSGENAPHGSAFNYLRNNFFDANDWFNDHYGVLIPALRQNDFGGTFGGPVWLPHIYDGHNRTFFFASYEGLRLTQPKAATIQYVPSLFLRANAPSALQPILNAFSIPTGPEVPGACDNVYISCPPGDPIGTMVPSGLSPFIGAYSLPSSVDSTSLRFDHVISPKLSIFFRFGYTPTSTTSRTMSNVTYTDINTQTETLGANIQFSRSLVNQFRLGYARSNTEGNQTVDNFGGATPVNLATAMGIGGYPNPSTYFDEYINTVGDAVLETFNPFDQSRQWNLTDTMSLSHGHHEFKVGIDYRRIKSPVVASGNPYVEFDFLTEDEILSNSALFAVFSKQASATPVFNETSLFVQDNWRATRNLNVAMGVRWEVDPAPGEAHGNYAYTTFGSVSDPSTLTLAPRGTPLWNTSWFNMAPRLGVAWTVHSTPGWETVLRTGGGVFFDTDNQLAPLAYSAIGFDAYQDTYFASIPATPADLNFSISTAPPYTGTIVVAFPSHLQLPYTLDWNTSLQQVLGKSQAVTISYVGSKGSRLLQWRRYSLNALNSNFGSVDALQNNITSNYQAMQVQFQRTAGRGVSVLAAYTWSHSLDYGSNDYSLPATRGNSDFDVRNNLTVGATWSLPSVQSQKLINALLKHWDVDGRFSARTGFPVTLYGNYFTDPTGDTYYGNLNLVPNEPIYLFGAVYPGGRAINPAAFSYPVGSGMGTAPRNFVRGFGAEQINLAAQRQIPLHERLNLKFRAEAFNLLNHPNFGYINPYLTQAQFGLATQMLNQSLTTMSSLYQQGGSRSLQFALKLSF